MFSEKLDYIMKLTGTQASMLGMACHLDPSYISRMRGGKRPLPKKPEYMRRMSRCLVSNVTDDYQRAALCETLCIDEFPANKEQAAKLIEKWLTSREHDGPDITPLLSSFSAPDPVYRTDGGSAELPEAKTYYYGINGKREAVLQFFNIILKEKEPLTLLLFSEEEMEWMYSDPAFAARWGAEFTKVLKAGNRVRIIHNVGRGLNELLEAVTKWIPIYATGMIEPYYYPKLRDGVFRRTLFIAQGTAAIASSSIERSSEGMLNELITDKEAVSALNAEFDNYFALCRPLMNIFTSQTRSALWKAYSALSAAEGEMICMSDSPTLATMPEWVAKNMQKRAPKSCIYEQWLTAAELMNELTGSRYIELVPDFDPNEEDVPLPCADLFGAEGICYKKDEWLSHIENSVKFADTHSGFVRIVKNDVPKNTSLFVKEGRGVIMTKRDSPGAAFAFSEPNMVSAFSDHIKRLLP